MKRIFLFLQLFSAAVLPVAVAADADVALPTVVVTSTMTEQNLDVAPGTVQVISKEEIEAIAAETVTDVLRQAAGMVIVTGTARNHSVSIRGLGSGHTLMLLDGRRMNSGYKTKLDVNQIPVTLIDHIEIVRGPGSAIYGSEATGGVINIITRRPPEKTEAEVDIRGGVGPSAEQAVQGMAGSAAGPFRFNIAASHFQKDDWDNDGELPDDIDDTSLDSVYVRSALDMGSAQTLTMGGEWNLFSREGKRLLQNLERERDADDQRWGGFVQYEAHPDGPFRGMFQVYGNKSENKVDITPDYDESERDRDMLQMEGRASYQMADGLTFTAGGEIRWETLEGEEMIETIEGEKSERVKAIFGQMDWTPLDWLNIVGSLRLDDYDNSGSHVTPRLIASVFIPHGRFWLSYGNGFRAPTLDELYGEEKARQGKYVYYGNSELEPETSQGYEAGIELRSPKMWGRIVGFYNRLDDLIEADLVSSQGSNRTYIYRNVDEATTYGAEMEAGISLAANLDLSANATWLSTENEDSGLDLAYEPDWKGKVSLTWRLPEYGLKTQVNYLYFGDCEDGDGGELDGYDLVNLYASKSLSENLKLYAGIDNLFKEENDDFTRSPLQFYAGINFSF